MAIEQGFKENIIINNKSYFGLSINKDTFRKIKENKYSNIDDIHINKVCRSSDRINKFLEKAEEGNIVKISPYVKYKTEFNKYPYIIDKTITNTEDYRYSYNIGNDNLEKEKIIFFEPYTKRSNKIAGTFIKPKDDMYKWGVFCNYKNKNEIDKNMYKKDINVSNIGLIPDDYILNVYEKYIPEKIKAQYHITKL